MVQARDPWTTASTLVAFLCAYNIILALCHITTSLLFGSRVNPIDRVWDFRESEFVTMCGYKTYLVHVTTAILSVPIEVIFVQRAKLILDFAMTIQFVHLAFTWLYSNAFPTSWAWWVTWITSSLVLVFGGEFICMRIELQPIVFGGGSGTARVTSASESRQSRSSRHSREDTGGFDVEMAERDKIMEEGTASKA